MKPVNISNAPINYRMYLREADAHPGSNGKIDTEAEAESAAKAICNEKGDECSAFLDYMEKASGYRPSRFKKELQLEQASNDMASLMPPLKADGKYELIGSDAAIKLGEIAKLGISPEDRSQIVEVLIQSLGNKASDGKSVSASVLADIVKSNISPEMNTKIVDALTGYIGDKDTAFRASVADSMATIAQSNRSSDLRLRIIRILIRCLTNKNTDVRASAVKALGEIAKADIPRELRSSIVDALIRSLGDDWSYRGAVEDALEGIAGVNASSALTSEMVNSLIKLLDDSFARSSAKDTLARIAKLDISPEQKSAIVDAFIHLLVDIKSGGNSELAGELKEIAKTATSQALRSKLSNAFIKYISNNDWDPSKSELPVTELQALVQLNLSQELNSKCFDILVQLLGDNSASNTNQAATVLKEIALMNVSGDASAHINISAESASMVIDALIKHVSDTDASIRTSAQSALSFLAESRISQGSRAKIVNAFIECLGNENRDVRASGALGLAYLPQHGFSELDSSPALKEKVIDALIACLGNDDNDIRGLGISGLGNIAGSSSTLYLFGLLVRSIRSDDPTVRLSAVGVLGGIANMDVSANVTKELRSEIIEYLIMIAKTDTNEGVKGQALSELKGIYAKDNGIPADIKAKIEKVIIP